MPSLERLKAHHATHRYQGRGNERQVTLPPPDLSKVYEFMPQEIIMNQGVSAEIERSSDLEIGELYLIRENDGTTRFALFYGISEPHGAIFDFGGFLEKVSDKAVFKVPPNFAEHIKPKIEAASARVSALIQNAAPAPNDEKVGITKKIAAKFGTIFKRKP